MDSTSSNIINKPKKIKIKNKKLNLICKLCCKSITKKKCFCDKLDYYNENIESIIKVQSLWRRKKVKLLKDGYTKQILNEHINKYNDICLFIDKINSQLETKKCRNLNYPSEITENLVKFAIIKKYNVSPSWYTKKGDLCLNGMQLEVKGSIDLMNGGPSSFGPKEDWSRIYFVDSLNCSIKNFIIYEIKLSNTSEIWKNIKVNKTQTYENQCSQGRRPRITFKELIQQIPKSYINILFNGYITDL